MVTRWDVLLLAGPVLWKSFIVTMQISVLTVIFGSVLGMVMTILYRFTGLFGKIISLSYVRFFRSIPLLYQILAIYILAPYYNLRVSEFTIVVFAISLDAGYHFFESFRSGLLAVPRGQEEASKALGMTKMHYIRRIIGPQAFRVCIPTYFNAALIVIKASTLAGAIGVLELSGLSVQLIQATGQPIPLLANVALAFFLLSLAFLEVQRRVERHLKVPS
jgi:His/Glu/Gln/Arg/opine family amino acid ABC transporter permease subunit